MDLATKGFFAFCFFYFVVGIYWNTFEQGFLKHLGNILPKIHSLFGWMHKRKKKKRGKNGFLYYNSCILIWKLLIKSSFSWIWFCTMFTTCEFNSKFTPCYWQFRNIVRSIQKTIFSNLLSNIHEILILGFDFHRQRSRRSVSGMSWPWTKTTFSNSKFLEQLL